MPRLTLKKQSSLQVHSEGEDQETEVHTLRREKKELKDELEQTKTKQLNFEAAFQTEFDLRSTMEEKYDSLRDRYEVRRSSRQMWALYWQLVYKMFKYNLHVVYQARPSFFCLYYTCKERLKLSSNICSGSTARVGPHVQAWKRIDLVHTTAQSYYVS